MKTLILTFIVLLTSFTLNDYPTKFGKPTPKGVEMYVEDNWIELIYEYQNFIKDSLWLDVWISAEDLTDWTGHDSLELGRYWNGEVIVSMDTLFDAYQLEDLSKFRRNLLGESNRFVKSTIFHELTHHYISQIEREMEYLDSVRVDRSYETNIWIIRSYDMFGATFIEEGICEYQVTKMEEIIPPKRYRSPKDQSDLVNHKNKYKYVYKYSSDFLRTFLDTTGFKKGVKILISNPPPNYNEIINPNLFFDRLDYEGLEIERKMIWD